MTAWRRSVATLALAALLPACATSRATPVSALADAPSASPASPAECGGDAVRAGLLGAATLGTWLMLRGAAEGALWGGLHGGSAAKDATWIGAAAGFGVGALIGFVTGAANGVGASQHRAVCTATALAAPEPGRPQPLTASELETLLPGD